MIQHIDPEEPINDPHAEQVVRVAHIARDLAHLPGAATRDWCRRAASILTDHDPGTRAWVLVVSCQPGGGHADSVGYAAGAECQNGDKPERLAVALTRLVCEAATGLTGPTIGSVGGLLDAMESPPWGTGATRAHRHIAVGLVRVGPSALGRGRLLAVLWDRPAARADGRAPDGLRLVLTSVLHVAGDRLAQALGDGANPWLSECEQRVLDMLTAGLSVPEIAEALERSPHTIHDHVKRLHAKLGTRTRGALLARVLGHQPRPTYPARTVRNGRPIVPFRGGPFVDHRAW